MDFAIGGIEVAGLIFGIVEFAKSFGINGKRSQVLAVLVGFLFMLTSQAIAGEILRADVVQYIEIVIKSLAGVLAAMGFYDFLNKRTVRK